MPERRIYLLDPKKFSPETIAVTFAKTSRSPLSFSEIASELTDEKSAEFHERWVVGYGHASVAEHAVLHIAVENISRLAVECLESNRLASYTEKSSRYQKWEIDQFHIPAELHHHPLEATYSTTCRALFQNYLDSIPVLQQQVAREQPRTNDESDSSWEKRVRAESIDVGRFFLPASALANVGVTINARALEHALRKMYSHPLEEVRSLGEEIASAALKEVPTLLKYIESVPYLRKARETLSLLAPCPEDPAAGMHDWCRVISYDLQGEDTILASALFRYCNDSYTHCIERVRKMDYSEKKQLAGIILSDLDRHDIPLRELEYSSLTFELTLDQGAWNELKRHRMMTQTSQPLNPYLGYATPALIIHAGLKDKFDDAMNMAYQSFEQLAAINPTVASYVIPNAYNRRLILQMNLRSALHFIKLRSAPTAHFSMRRVALRLAEEIGRIYPLLSPHFQPAASETWQSIEKGFFA